MYKKAQPALALLLVAPLDSPHYALLALQGKVACGCVPSASDHAGDEAGAVPWVNAIRYVVPILVTTDVLSLITLFHLYLYARLPTGPKCKARSVAWEEGGQRVCHYAKLSTARLGGCLGAATLSTPRHLHPHSCYHSIIFSHKNQLGHRKTHVWEERGTPHKAVRSGSI